MESRLVEGVTGIWFTLASDGIVRRLVRSKVWQKGVTVWDTLFGLPPTVRTGRTILTVSVEASYCTG